MATHPERKRFPWASPLRVTATFYLPRGKKTGEYPTGPPDVDKLLRGVLDAITTSGAWRDDAIVVDTTARKRYYDDPARGTSGSGAEILIEPIMDTP
jgi:Holliday junction resolvase RusA-like endonuclease